MLLLWICTSITSFRPTHHMNFQKMHQVSTTALTTLARDTLLTHLGISSPDTKLLIASFHKVCVGMAKDIMPTVKQLRTDHPAAKELWDTYCTQRTVKRAAKAAKAANASKKRTRADMEEGEEVGGGWMRMRMRMRMRTPNKDHRYTSIIHQSYTHHNM